MDRREFLMRVAAAGGAAVLGGCRCSICANGERVPNGGLKGGRIVFFGDSITQAGGYVAWVQYLWNLRHPACPATMLNAGVAGQTAYSALGRFDWDVAPLKPDQVVVSFGMNDVGRDGIWDPSRTDEKTLALRRTCAEDYRKSLREIVAKCRAIGAEVTLVTPPPYDEYSENPGNDPLSGMNELGLKALAAVTREVAAADGTRLVDWYGPLTSILREHPEADFLTDRVHPGEEGHFLLSLLLLESLEKPREPAVMKFDASGGVRNFVCKSDALPVPCCQEGAVAAILRPFIRRLGGETLRVTGLPPGRYRLLTGGKTLGVRTSEELAAGIDLGGMSTPLLEKARKGLPLVRNLRDKASALRTLAQGRALISANGGHFDDSVCAVAAYEAWLADFRKRHGADSAVVKYYARQVETFKRLCPVRAEEMARLEKMRRELADFCRPEAWEFVLEGPLSAERTL